MQALEPHVPPLRVHEAHLLALRSRLGVPHQIPKMQHGLYVRLNPLGGNQLNIREALRLLEPPGTPDSQSDNESDTSEANDTDAREPRRTIQDDYDYDDDFIDDGELVEDDDEVPPTPPSTDDLDDDAEGATSDPDDHPLQKPDTPKRSPVSHGFVSFFVSKGTLPTRANVETVCVVPLPTSKLGNVVIDFPPRAKKRLQQEQLPPAAAEPTSLAIQPTVPTGLTQLAKDAQPNFKNPTQSISVKPTIAKPQSTVAKPSAAKPSAAKPSAAKPSATSKLSTAKPSAAKLSISKPLIAKPSSTKAASTKLQTQSSKPAKQQTAPRQQRLSAGTTAASAPVAMQRPAKPPLPNRSPDAAHTPPCSAGAGVKSVAVVDSSARTHPSPIPVQKVGKASITKSRLSGAARVAGAAVLQKAARSPISAVVAKGGAATPSAKVKPPPAQVGGKGTTQKTLAQKPAGSQKGSAWAQKIAVQKTVIQKTATSKTTAQKATMQKALAQKVVSQKGTAPKTGAQKTSVGGGPATMPTVKAKAATGGAQKAAARMSTASTGKGAGSSGVSAGAIVLSSGSGSGSKSVTAGKPTAEAVIVQIERLSTLCTVKFGDRKPRLNDPRIQEQLHQVFCAAITSGTARLISDIAKDRRVSLSDDVWSRVSFLRTKRANLETLGHALVWNAREKVALQMVENAATRLQLLLQKRCDAAMLGDGARAMEWDLGADEAIYEWYKAKAEVLVAKNQLGSRVKQVKKSMVTWVGGLRKQVFDGWSVSETEICDAIRRQEEKAASERRERGEKKRKRGKMSAGNNGSSGDEEGHGVTNVGGKKQAVEGAGGGMKGVTKTGVAAKSNGGQAKVVSRSTVAARRPVTNGKAPKK